LKFTPRFPVAVVSPPNPPTIFTFLSIPCRYLHHKPPRRQDAAAMGLANLAAGLMLWAAWMPALRANFTLPSDPGMMELAEKFQDFMAKFGKTYNSQEEMIYRFKVFAQNMETSQVLQDTELGTAQYGITPFSDLTESEFAKKFGNPVLQAVPFGLTEPPRSFMAAPQFCDWRKKGLSPVKAQVSVDREKVLDCTYRSREGCLGGYVWDAFQYVFNNSGLVSSALYPYIAENHRCLKFKKQILTKIDGYSVLPRDEKYIANMVATQGPVTALINQKHLQHYRNGIIQRSKVGCDPNWLDHAVLIVGFGEGKVRRGTWSGSYWIIQNSWGKHWGEEVG
ncbi:hypothetical protein E2320_013824, partial [Naja naja]